MNVDTQLHPSLTHCQTMLHELVQQRGHSIARIARSCGLTPSIVHDILKGHTKQPRPIVFRKILTLYCWTFHRPSLQLETKINARMVKEI